MQTKFKPAFLKDVRKAKRDGELMVALYKVFANVEKAERVNAINNIKRWEQFDARCRIKLFLDRKRDYRIGLYAPGRTVWFTRFLHRKKIYEANW